MGILAIIRRKKAHRNQVKLARRNILVDKAAHWWKRLHKRLRPPKSYFQKFYESQAELYVDAVLYQDFIYEGQEEEPEFDEHHLLGVDTEEVLEKLQKVSIPLLYESSRRLERLTSRLFWITVVLAILTVLLVTRLAP